MSFKLKHSGVPALMKTLTAGQKNMVQSMRKAGKTEAADKIQRGIEKEPIRKDPGDKRAKSSSELRRDAEGRVVGTSTERGGDQPLSTQRSTRMIAGRTGRSFDETGKTKNQKMDLMKSLKIVNGTVQGAKDPQTGKMVLFDEKDYFSTKDLNKSSKVGGQFTGTGLKTRAGRSAVERIYKYNQGIDNINIESDRASKVVAAERAGEQVQYAKEKKEPTRTVKAAPRKLGVKGLAKKAAPKKYGSKAKKAAPKKYGCKKK